MSQPICGQCNSDDVATHWVETMWEVGTHAPITLTAQVPQRTCQACGFKFLDSEAFEIQHKVQMEKLHG